MEQANRIPILPGVTLTHIPSDKYKTDSLSVSFLRPLCRQEAALNSLLPEVLLQGSRTLPDMQAIADHLDDLYGADVETMNRRRGEVHVLGLYADCVMERYTGQAGTLEALIHTLCEFLLDPVLENGAFRADYVSQEKQNLLQAIQAQINDKRVYAGRRLLETMFGSEAYGVSKLGTEADVAAITPQSLYAHYQTVLSQSRVELFYMGQTPAQAVAGLFRDALRELPRQTPAQVGTQVIRRAEQTRELVETADVTQGRLLLGFRTDCMEGEPDYPALELCSAVLGGTVSSKLFQKVREELSLCYYAGSSLDRSKGVMTISSGIAFENYQIAKAAILRQLEGCRAGRITEHELESARSYLRSTLQISQDSQGRQEELCLGQAITGSRETFQSRIRQLEQVTLEDVCAAARKLSLDTVYFLRGEEDHEPA